jgi:hypothetical protein
VVTDGAEISERYRLPFNTESVRVAEPEKSPDTVALRSNMFRRVASFCIEVLKLATEVSIAD